MCFFEFLSYNAMYCIKNDNFLNASDSKSDDWRSSRSQKRALTRIALITFICKWPRFCNTSFFFDFNNRVDLVRQTALLASNLLILCDRVFIRKVQTFGRFFWYKLDIFAHVIAEYCPKISAKEFPLHFVLKHGVYIGESGSGLWLFLSNFSLGEF